jgi:hypothetical protein
MGSSGELQDLLIFQKKPPPPRLEVEQQEVLQQLLPVYIAVPKTI